MEKVLAEEDTLPLDWNRLLEEEEDPEFRGAMPTLEAGVHCWEGLKEEEELLLLLPMLPELPRL